MMQRIQLLFPKPLMDRIAKAKKLTGLSLSEMARAAMSAYLTGLGV